MLPAKRNGHMNALMLNPDRLEGVCRDYLGIAEVPNVAGLCVALGSTPHFLHNLFAENKDKTEDLISAEERLRKKDAVAILSQTLLGIEDTLLSRGLLGEYNAHMTKFALSAYHNRNEKTLHETKSDNTLSIHIASHSPIDLDELKEYQRLEQAMKEQTELELISMGRIRNPDDDDEDDEDGAIHDYGAIHDDGVEDIIAGMYEQHEPTTEEDECQI